MHVPYNIWRGSSVFFAPVNISEHISDFFSSSEKEKYPVTKASSRFNIKIHNKLWFAFDFHNYLASEDTSQFLYSSPFYFHTEILPPF